MENRKTVEELVQKYNDTELEFLLYSQGVFIFKQMTSDGLYIV